MLWPAAIVAGVRAENWITTGRKLQFQALALGVDGKPQAGVPGKVEAISRVTTSPKRLVGALQLRQPDHAQVHGHGVHGQQRCPGHGAVRGPAVAAPARSS
ncbi:Otoferlin [Manis javanica]|nr:Otoferlin [Manis javanica]